MSVMLAACIAEIENEKAPYAARRLPLLTGIDDSQVQEINCSTFQLEKVVEPTRS